MGRRKKAREGKGRSWKARGKVVCHTNKMPRNGGSFSGGFKGSGPGQWTLLSSSDQAMVSPTDPPRSYRTICIFSTSDLRKLVQVPRY
jgi:hypothetical protein